jgi:hypothetical protein
LLDTRKSLRGICLQLVEEANDSTLTDPSVPFIVITFDQPNHGERTINTQRNLSWKQGNPHYGLDMWTCMQVIVADCLSVFASFFLTDNV